MTDQERQSSSTRDLVIRMSVQVDEMHTRIDSIPRDCATHQADIEALKTGQQNIWKAIGGKASWAAVLVVLTAFGAVMVGVAVAAARAGAH